MTTAATTDLAACLALVGRARSNASFVTENHLRNTMGDFLYTHGDTLQRALALLEAVESGETFGAWQPIETAPKDGRDIWLFTPNDEPQQVVGYWAESWGGWNWRDTTLSDAASEEMQPTRWMPLPPTPGAGVCWCETCRPITPDDMRFVMCPDCGNKRCPRATNHVNDCTGSNEPGQPGSSWENVKPGAGVGTDEHDRYWAKQESGQHGEDWTGYD